MVKSCESELTTVRGTNRDVSLSLEWAAISFIDWGGIAVLGKNGVECNT